MILRNRSIPACRTRPGEWDGKIDRKEVTNLAGKRRIRKVKVTSDNKIQMVYEAQSKTGAWDEYSFTCSEEARPEFYQMMKRMAVHVVEMCELPDNYLSRIQVKGVSFSFSGEKDVMGATISAQMKLENSYNCLNLNTPHKASDSYSDVPADPMQLLSGDCIDDLEKLAGECEVYINGERAQGKLFAVA
jgi:hypothetical protein